MAPGPGNSSSQSGIENMSAELLEKAVTESPEKAVTESPEKAVTESPEEAVPESPEEAVVTELPEEVIAESPDEAITESPEKAVDVKVRQCPYGMVYAHGELWEKGEVPMKFKFAGGETWTPVATPHYYDAPLDFESPLLPAQVSLYLAKAQKATNNHEVAPTTDSGSSENEAQKSSMPSPNSSR